MKIESLTIPDNPEHWPAWLEQQLLGLELGATVLELEIFAGDSLTSNRSLSDTIGSNLSWILKNGMTTVDPAVVRALLRQPSLLLELQERILIEGGDYWQQQISELDVSAPSVESFKTPGEAEDEDSSDHKPELAEKTSASKLTGRKSIGRRLAVLVAIAASIFVIA